MTGAFAISGGVLRRERLFALLKRATRSGSAWVSGPPGSGKTTLVASYLDRRKLPALWHRVHAGNADLASFFYDLAQRCPPRARSRLPSFTPEYRGGEVAFSRRFFRELARARRRPFALVLDDLHEVASSAAVSAALADGIGELGPGVAAFLLSREEPPAALARLVGNGVVTPIPGDALRLTQAEALAIARARAPGRPRGDLVRACEAAAGWAAGLVLLLNAATQFDTRVYPGGALFRYLAREVFERADAEVRRVLLHAAVPSFVPVRLARALCESERAAKILQGLANSAYFMLRREGDEPAFELHPMLREFLLEHGRTERAPDEIRRLSARMASVLAPTHPQQALELYVAAEAWNEVARVALTLAPSLMATGRLASLNQWLGAVPEAMRSNDPWISYWYGVSITGSDPAIARAELARARVGFDARGDTVGLHLAFVSAIHAFVSEWADFSGMDRWIDAFEDDRRRYGPCRVPEVEQRAAVAMLAALTLHRAEGPSYREWEQRGLAIVQDGSAPLPARVAAATYLMLACVFRGELGRSAELLDLIAPISHAPGIDPLTAITWSSMEAIHHWNAGSAEKALRSIEVGLGLGSAHGVHAWDYILHIQSALTHATAGDCAGAAAALEAAEACFDARRALNYSTREHARAQVALCEGKTTQAREHGRKCLESMQRTGMSFDFILGDATLLRAATLGHDEPAARVHLEIVRQSSEMFGNSLGLMLCHLCEAQLTFQAAPEAAIAAAEKGFRISRQKGIPPQVWFTRAQVATLCALAIASTETESAAALVRRLDLAAPDWCNSERWPWPVRVGIFGDPEIAVRGEPVLVGTRVQRRPLDVLALVALSPEHAPAAAAVSSALWPDAEGDASQHALETALYRLRKLVGENVVRQRDGLLVLNRSRCWTDVAAFQARLACVAASLQRRDPGGAVDAAEHALALYRGPLLPGRDEPWVLAAREGQRARVRRCLGDLERLGADRAAVQRLTLRVEAADPEVRALSGAGLSV